MRWLDEPSLVEDAVTVELDGGVRNEKVPVAIRPVRAAQPPLVIPDRDVHRAVHQLIGVHPPNEVTNIRIEPDAELSNHVVVTRRLGQNRRDDVPSRRAVHVDEHPLCEAQADVLDPPVVRPYQYAFGATTRPFVAAISGTATTVPPGK